MPELEKRVAVFRCLADRFGERFFQGLLVVRLAGATEQTNGDLAVGMPGHKEEWRC